MTDMTITREVLKRTHTDASAELIARGLSRERASQPGHLWAAVSVTCLGRMGGHNKMFNVQIDLQQLQDPQTLKPAKPFHWSGRAHNAYEARNRAWQSWMRASIALSE